MAKVYDGIDADMAAWIAGAAAVLRRHRAAGRRRPGQPLAEGRTGTFRVLDAHTFAYLDLTGSGVETVAHLRENGRICVMFCAFDGSRNRAPARHRPDRCPRGPRVRGGDRRLRGGGAEPAGLLRAVIVVDVARVADACGYAVPQMDLVEDRPTLDAVWGSRDDDRIAAYQAQKNATSLDGLPGLAPAGRG